MTNTKTQEIVEEARQLPPHEQLDLIRALSESLQSQDGEAANQLDAINQALIASRIKQTKPATNLDDYAADFWPEDESVDELNNFIHRQRATQAKIEELEHICGEVYQVVGSLAGDLKVFEDPAVEKVLDNLSQFKLVHKDVLPFIVKIPDN